MTSTKHGTARLRGLAAELVDMRANAGLNTREAARLVGFSPATLNRMENGNRAVSPEDVASLLAVYGVTGTERERILDLARQADQPGWWETGGAGLPAQLPALVSFEAEATRIVHAALLRIPGLLQTADYTRAIMKAAGVQDDDMERRVAIRLGRQAVLTRLKPPEYLALLDESVLRRPVGGRAVMAEQLRYILRMSARPNIDIRVIPFERGEHGVLGGPYILMDFAKAGSVVHIEARSSGMFVDGEDRVRPFREATEALLDAALGMAESAEFLAAVSAEYEQE